MFISNGHDASQIVVAMLLLSSLYTPYNIRELPSR